MLYDIHHPDVNIITKEAVKLGFSIETLLTVDEKKFVPVHIYMFRYKNNELYTYKEMQKIILKNKINNL